jgi:bifunctional DNA-binding transcriptional regulator/antitoxin component of YhaV-PrlF toxin-antitoxin module
MKNTTISKGGQVSIPASVRRRWGTSHVVLEDQGTAVVIRPIPADPIGAAMGSLRGRGPSTDKLRRLVRDEETATDVDRGNQR